MAKYARQWFSTIRAVPRLGPILLAVGLGPQAARSAENLPGTTGLTNWLDRILSGTLSSQSHPAGLEMVSQQPLVRGRAASTANWTPLGDGQKLNVGDQIETRAKGQAALVHPRVAAGLGPTSELEVLAGELHLLKGSLYAKDIGPTNSPLWVNAERVTIKPIGTEYYIQADPVRQRTELAVAAGEVEIRKSSGALLTLHPGQQANLGPNPPASLKPEPASFNRLIQWMLYYPAILDLEDLSEVAGFAAFAKDSALSGSIAAYLRGDVVRALEEYPAQRSPVSDAERLYAAATALAAGQVADSERLLGPLRPAGRAVPPTGRTQRLAHAIERVTQAVRSEVSHTSVEPTCSSEWMAESYYLQSRSAFGPARRAAQRAAAVNPRFGFSHARVADLELSFGTLRGAKSEVAQALELSPDSAQALTVQGFVLAAEHRPREAYAAFQRAIELDPRLGNAWLGLGLYYACAGEKGKALRCLQIAALREPQRPVLRSYLARGYRAVESDRRAQGELELSAHDAKVRSREEVKRAEALDPSGRQRTAWIAPHDCLPGPSGLYVGVDAGPAWVNTVKAQSLTLADDCRVEPANEVSFDPGIRVDLQLGYRLSEAFAVGLETGLIWNSVNSFLGASPGSSFTVPGADSSLDVYAGHVELYQVPILADLVYQMPIKGRLSARAGVGVGLLISTLNLDDTSVSCYNDATFHDLQWDHATDVVFAYQGVVGFNYALSEHVMLGLAYKFLGTTDHSWRDQGAELKTDPTYTHSLLATFRYEF